MLKLKKDKFIKSDEIKKIINLNIINSTSWLAGGALRASYNSEEIKDYDMFFKDVLSLNLSKTILENNNYEKIFDCPEGKLTTYKKENIKIQLVSENYYYSCEKLLDEFDITACRYAFDGKYVYCYFSSIRDTKNKKIDFHKITYPMASMKRIQKYIKKGYTLKNKSIEKFINNVKEMQNINGRFYID